MSTEPSPGDAGRHWHKVLDPGELPEGRVKPVTFDETTVAVTHYDGEYHALDNACPHQGGPLGEGSIENGLLRCPWHGWDFYPDSGETRPVPDEIRALVEHFEATGEVLPLEDFPRLAEAAW